MAEPLNFTFCPDPYEVYPRPTWRQRLRYWRALAIRPFCALAGHVRFRNGGYGCERCWSRKAFR